MQVSEGKLASISRFEKVPADEERLIRDMAGILQEKMSRDHRKGQTRCDAHSKNLACLQAEFKVEPNIPTREREDLAEDLSFSPAHSLMAHRPIGGVNRARVEIYRTLSEFRHAQNNKSLGEQRQSDCEGTEFNGF